MAKATVTLINCTNCNSTTQRRLIVCIIIMRNEYASPWICRCLCFIVALLFLTDYELYTPRTTEQLFLVNIISWYIFFFFSRCYIFNIKSHLLHGKMVSDSSWAWAFSQTVLKHGTFSPNFNEMISIFFFCHISWSVSLLGKKKLSYFHWVLLRVWDKLAIKLCCHLSNDYHSCRPNMIKRCWTKQAKWISGAERKRPQRKRSNLMNFSSLSPFHVQHFSCWIIGMARDESCGWFECKFI